MSLVGVLPRLYTPTLVGSFRNILLYLPHYLTHARTHAQALECRWTLP